MKKTTMIPLKQLSPLEDINESVQPSEQESIFDHPKVKRPLKFINLAKALTISRFKVGTPFVRFIPTDACNLSCSYCWQRRDDAFQMNEESFDKYLEKAKKHNVGMITFLGGEPMIWKHLYSSLAKCTKENVLTDITTNGTALNQKNINKLAKAGLDFLNISVDGITQSDISQKNSIIAKGNILDHLKSAKQKYGMRYRVNSVIYNDNFAEIKQLIEFSKQHDIPISLGYIVPPTDKDHIGDPAKYFTKKDIPFLREIVTYIVNKIRDGYPIIDPEAYFEGIFAFLDKKHFWDCNYPTRYGWINITPRGELRSCTKKMDEVPGFTFLSLDKNRITDLKSHLKKEVSECNSKCYSNCAFDAHYYRENNLATVKKALGINSFNLMKGKYVAPM